MHAPEIHPHVDQLKKECFAILERFLEVRPEVFVCPLVEVERLVAAAVKFVLFSDRLSMDNFLATVEKDFLRGSKDSANEVLCRFFRLILETKRKLGLHIGFDQRVNKSISVAGTGVISFDFRYLSEVLNSLALR